MKKKFLNYVLLGLLSLCTFTFVACSDDDTKYDEQLEDIQNQINSLKTLIDNVGPYVSNLTYDPNTGVLTVTKRDINGNESSSTLTLSQNLPEYSMTINSETGVISLLKDGVVVSSGTVPAGEGTTIVNEFDYNKLTVGDDGYVYYDGNQTAISLGTTSFTVMYDDETGEIIGYTITDGAGNSAEFWINDSLPLKSLVFVPQAYLGGIQAMRVAEITYAEEWVAGKYTVNSTGEIYTTKNTTGLDEDGNKVNTPVSIAPAVFAYYHLNPGSVTADQIVDVTVVSDDKQYITKAAASGPSVTENGWSVTYDAELGGLLKVKFDFKDLEKIMAVDADDVTTLAVQANVDFKGETTTVTSDYAAVYKTKWSDFVLALNDVKDADHANALNQRHVYGADSETGSLSDPLGKAQTAIEEVADYTLSYKATTKAQGLDLKEKVTVHYMEVLDKKSGAKQTEYELKNLEDYGFELKFSKSDYIQGTNETHQNDFFNLEDGIVWVEVFKTDGGKSAVGREPLVRVELVDTNTGLVVNVGWIKIAIVDEIDPIVIPFGEFYVECNTEFMPTVEQVNLLVYKVVDKEADVFHTLYKFAGWLGKDGGIITSTATNPTDADGYGYVEEVDEGDGYSTKTNLLKWYISGEEQVAALNDKDNPGELYITAVYAPTNASSTSGSVYIKFTATVKELTASLSGKTQQLWFNNYQNIYVNSVLPASTTQLDQEYYSDIDNFFNGTKPVFTLSDTDAATNQEDAYGADNLKYYYQFSTDKDGYTYTGASGVEYTLTSDNSYISSDNQSYLLATAVINKVKTTQLVATINTESGIVEYNRGEGVIHAYTTDGNPITNIAYTGNKDADFAFDILNAAEAKAESTSAYSDKIFTAPVEVILNNGCDYPITLTNGTFNIGFLRPINVLQSDIDEIIDGNGAEIEVSTLIKLTDWRDGASASTIWDNAHFSKDSKLATYGNYWYYYNVESVEVDIDGITTTVDGEKLGTDAALLSNYGNQFTVSFTTGSAATASSSWVGSEVDNVTVNTLTTEYGTFNYHNNSGQTQPYELRLPIVVTYRWGKITTYIDVTVVQ